MKVAKLVLWSPMVRVVVEDDATYEEIIEAARGKFNIVLADEYEENIEEVMDDLECPYAEEFIKGAKYEVLSNRKTQGWNGHEFQVGEIVECINADGASGNMKGEPIAAYPEHSTWWMDINEVKKLDNE
jgi:hypothetical protein